MQHTINNKPAIYKPGIMIPQAFFDAGFEDASWPHADIACMEKKLANSVLHLWCAEEDPMDRTNSDMSRFLLMVGKDSDSCKMFEAVPIAGTNSAKAVLAIVKAIDAAIAEGQ